jgi:hypothetical protein
MNHEAKSEPDMLTIPDVMRILQVSRTVAYDVAHSVGITRIGRNGVRVARSKIDDYIKARTEPGMGRKPRLTKLKRQIEALAKTVERLDDES